VADVGGKHVVVGGEGYWAPALTPLLRAGEPVHLVLTPGSRAALLARMEQTILVDPEPLLRRIEVPVLLVWGVKDAMIPVANSADYQRALPAAELVTFADLGHLPHEEAPAESLRPVRAFLER
jgi:pimeloyl-ACP methyl ester carboxylesterase